MYDFDRIIDRRNTGSLKWDVLASRYGNPDAIPMWVADSEFECPREVVAAIKARAEHPIYGYDLRGGEYYLSLVRWMKRRHDWDISRDWVLFSPGIVPALAMFVRSLTEPGDGIVVQPPVYNPFFSVVEENGRRLMRNELIRTESGFEMDFADLEDKFAKGAKLFIFCNPGNPSGRVWTREELNKVAELCVKYRVHVVSDDIHSDIVLDGHKYTPLASLGPEIEQLTATCMSPSKTFNVAGLSSSGIIIPNEEMLERYWHEMQAMENDLGNVFGHVAFSACYDHGEEYLEELLRYLQGNRDYIVDFTRSNMPRVKALKNEGTYMTLLDFSELGLEGAGVQDFLAKQAGVAVKAGYVFGQSISSCARLNYACPRSVVVEAMDRIKAAVDSL